MAPLLSRERRLDSARRRVRKLWNHMLAEKADRVQHAPLLDDAAIHDEDHVFDAELVLEALDLLGHRVGRADDVEAALQHLLVGLRHRPFLALHAQRLEEAELAEPMRPERG